MLDTVVTVYQGCAMPDPSRIPPPRRAELIIAPPGADGGQVVKDPQSGEFFHLGPEEAFLLGQLDGRLTAAEVRAAYEQRFSAPLDDDDLDGFIEMARGSGFLARPDAAEADAAPAKKSS